MRWALPLLLVLLAGPAVNAGDEIVTARLEWEPGTVGTVSAGRVSFKDAPEQDVIVPTGLVNPRYARIKMADTKGLALAFDAVEGSPRLWVDHDLDGDLTNENRTHLGRAGTNYFRRQVVLARYDDEPEVVPVTLYFSHMPSNGADYLTVSPRVHRRGTVVLGGRLRLIALVDNSSDVCFDDAKRDRLYLDLNGDGQFQTAGSDPAERIQPGVPFRVGDEGWIAKVTSPSGRAVEFTRTEEVPPARPRRWPTRGAPTPGVTRTPPTESFETLKQRFESEASKAYADRYQTVNRIGYVGTKAAFDLLLRISQTDKENNIRSAALRAMGNAAYLKIGGDTLLALAKKATTQTASSLAQALFYMGHPKRDAVYQKMMKSSESSLMSASARWLAHSQTPAARRIILDAVRSHGVPAARYSAYTQGARYLDGGPPIDIVLRAAEDSYPTLRAEAIKDLGVLGHPDARKLALELAKERPVNVSVGMALAQVLGAAGDPRSVAAILALLEDEQLHANVRKKVLEHLRYIRAPKSVAVLVAALQSKTPAVRAVAAEILAAIPERDVTVALLRRAKREKDTEVLPLLLEALGDHGDQLALEALLKYAKRKRSTTTRRAAIRALARLGLQQPRVRSFFLGLLEARNWEDRILALDAAASSGDVDLTRVVVKSLGHEEWQVRLAAVEALDAFRCLPAIEPLINQLAVEEEERVRDAIAVALFRMTGMNFYDNAEIWRRWWETNEEGFQIPDEIPTLPEAHAGGTQAGFYGIPVKSDRVVFVIDQSGSMSAPGEASDDEKESLNRLDVAVRETLGAIAKLKKRARVNVILFHSTIHPWKDSLQRLSSGNRNALKRHLESKRPTGGTNLYDGLEMALNMKDVDTIFLLSDGAPGLGKYVATPDILRAVRRENQTRRVAVHCVSIGLDSELLRRLAAENGGRYVRR